MIEDIQMEDLGAKGQTFTWANKRRGRERINERLDCILISSLWANKFTNAPCIKELAIGSHHSPLILVTHW